MNNWKTPPAPLKGNTVTLISLEKEHLAELEMVAKDKRIWDFYAYDASDSVRFQEIFEEAFVERAKGTQFPFVIFHHAHHKIIGSTRLWNMELKHRKLEIGATWLHPDYWATGINTECKLLLLTFCFEELHTSRVYLKTDENNHRSRKAIAKIGGKFEGILRNDMIRDNLTKRNSAYFGLIEEEWSETKQSLVQLIIDN
jgi:N-acetyltransferase